MNSCATCCCRCGRHHDNVDQAGRQTDDTYGINAAVRWKINRHSTTGASVIYTKRSSNVGIDRSTWTR